MVIDQVRHPRPGPARRARKGGGAQSRKPAVGDLGQGSAGGQPAEILVVEDDPKIAEYLGWRAGEYFNKPVALAGSLREARAVLDRACPRIVLLDMLLPDGDGTELLLRLGRDDAPAVAVVTAAPSLYRATVALRTRAADFLVKPFTDEQLTATFERLARRLAEIDDQCRLRQQAQASGQTNDQLRMKIDILCKDLVGGYQKLVSRMVKPE